MTSTLNKGRQQETQGSARRKWLGLSIAGITAVGLALVLVYFFGGAEPAEVDLDATVNAVSQTTAIQSTTGPSTSGPSTSGLSTSGPSTSGQSSIGATDAATVSTPAGVSGEWSVDTTTGTFSFEEATATFAGFRVEEELVQIGATTAVGRTPDVSGTVTIDGTTITQAEIQVDLTTIVSDESRRENAIREVLNTGQNPNATFVLTGPIDFGQVPSDGVTVSANAIGDLTINGVTRTVEIPLEAQVSGESILIVGSTAVLFADYEVETPSAPVVLSVADEGTIELQLWLVRA